MNLLNYQRTIFGYHGCDRSVAEAVLSGKQGLGNSDNDYDWLGHGIYFWEHGPNRAIEWAQQRSRFPGSNILEPAVIGAVIHLGVCIDLLDTHSTDLLADYYPAFIAAHELEDRPVPQNRQHKAHPHDWLLRELDCQLINWAIPKFEINNHITVQTVRGAFIEGDPAYPGAGIRKKSHIQVAVRDVSAIVGYFRPIDLD
jgi:hypothetical protein